MINKQDIINLYRECATIIPSDIEASLKLAYENEIDATPKENLKTILENIEFGKIEKKPICQDTGTPFFFIECPQNISQIELTKIINDATVDATKDIPLRPNATDPITSVNIGNYPVIKFTQTDSKKLKITLMMKGGGSENITQLYSLPNTKLNANRNIEGIKKCVLDAVFQAQGKGCPPYIIGVGVGGTVEETSAIAKKQLLRKIDDNNSDKQIDEIEKDLLTKINSLGIGPMGLGGKTTALSVKLAKTYRNPPSYFVAVSFGCWALRRASHEY